MPRVSFATCAAFASAFAILAFALAISLGSSCFENQILLSRMKRNNKLNFIFKYKCLRKEVCQTQLDN